MHVSEDDTVLITTTPLTEMVWSQSEGLSLQYVAPGLGDTKGSVFWDTESFNIVVSSPKCTNDGECSNSNDLAEGDINPLQLKPNHETKNYDYILSCSPINSICSSGGSVIRIDEHDSKTSGDLTLSKKIEVDLAQILGKKQSADKVIASSVDALQTHEKIFDSGPVKPGLQPDCLACNLMELRPDMLLPNVECASDVRYSANHMEELDNIEIFQTSSLLPAAEGCSLTKCGRSLKADGCSNTGGECFNGQMTPGRRTCDGERQTFDFGVNIPCGPQPTGDAKDQSFRASHKGKSVLIGSLSIDNLNCSSRGKGKAQVLFDTEDQESTSKASEDSHDSVESCNSKRIMSRGKRASNYDLKTSIENKRSKKQTFKGSSSSSLLRQTGSFMNWALTITRGFSRFCEATPLRYAPPLSNQVEGNVDCRSLSHADEKNIGILHGDMGFKSIFESVYLPGSNVKNRTTSMERAKEVKVEGEQFGYSNSQIHCKRAEFNLHRMLSTKSDRVSSASKYHSPGGWFNFHSLHVVCDEGGNELHNEVSLTKEILDKNIDQANVFLSAKSNLSRSALRFHKKLCDSGLTGDLGSIVSTCSTQNNSYKSSPTDKRSGTIVAVSESSRKLVSKNKTEFPQNLWITRFSPKVSSTITNHMQCMELGSQSLTKSCDALEPLSQNHALHSKDQGCMVNSNEMNLIALKRQEEHLKIEDEKFKSKLNPILPSCKVQKMEMTGSSFAKRLDMRRSSKLSEVPDNVTLTATTCFFCGKSSHGMRACT